MRILGIESSCDETGAAIVEDGRFVHSAVVASQADLHARYGGVVPEVASRQQLADIIPVLESALAQAHLDLSHVDAVAATHGPGLAGSLLVGLTAGKAIAWAEGLPFVGVNHLEGHIYANWLTPLAASSPYGKASDAAAAGVPRFPLVALVVSGAHTELVHIPDHGRYELLGQTRDDAAGEAFDKVARLLGLGYPGGPAIQRTAAARQPQRPNPYRLPRAWLRGTRDFSFSGLKTAVLRLVEREGHTGEGATDWPTHVADIAAAFQDSVVDVLVTKTVAAACDLGVAQVVLAGGVAANSLLRERLETDLARHSIQLSAPAIAYCTDNAAMIAGAAYFHLLLGERSSFDLDVNPGLQLPFVTRPPSPRATRRETDPGPGS